MGARLTLPFFGARLLPTAPPPRRPPPLPVQRVFPRETAPAHLNLPPDPPAHFNPAPAHSPPSNPPFNSFEEFVVMTHQLGIAPKKISKSKDKADEREADVAARSGDKDLAA